MVKVCDHLAHGEKAIPSKPAARKYGEDTNPSRPNLSNQGENVEYSTIPDQSGKDIASLYLKEIIIIEARRSQNDIFLEGKWLYYMY
ncbi:hypothetical protein QYM36_003919 [Artemia franciscana]|uniref:Uncharacterized protein n=1 Tax=Artemia franciscana TaxID=6661 RepID=A0AA88I5C2_ARTSF|nr:hypothetical protein QYM36_003896 [Artemia franciscana]KAK2721766.1 hypothetical protein QYM36_003919 [Artemia franciscana]